MKQSLKKILYLLIIGIFLLSALSGCIAPREKIMINGVERTYILHLPESYDVTQEVPLVIVLHGGGGNAESIEDKTGFSKKADLEGFIVVYPDGTGKLPKKFLTWNAGFCCGYALENNIDDVTFIESLIEHLISQYNINESRIYVTGLSNGGCMAYRIGAELSDIIAAIAPVAGSIGGQTTEEEKIWRIPEPEYPVSVISFHGMNDSRVPYDGGKPINNGSHVYWWMSVNESIEFWIYHNQCNAFPKRNISESGNIIIDIFAGGMDNTEVNLVSIVNGSHSWPGGKTGRKNRDVPTQEISATDMMWEFFKTHPKILDY